jgi:HAD superfamily hydrolase (TIGR01509 family)
MPPPSFLSSFKAAIFDMDGLMLDTENHTFHCLNLACQELDLEFPLDLYTKLIGRRSSETPPIIYAHLGDSFPLDVILKRAGTIRSEHIAQGKLRKKAGVEEIISFLNDSGIALGVATSSHRNEALELLSIVGLAKWFPVIVGGNQIKRSKPEPDIFCEAAKQLGIAPNHCLVFEDSEAGVTAARSAGMHVVMVPDMKQPSEAVAKLANCVVTSLHEALKLISQ